MSEHRIDVEDDAGVRLVTFDRPEARNAFDTAMYVAVTGALSAALADDGIRSVVVTGRGKAFTAGQDLREMAAMATGDGGPAAGSGFQGLMDAVVSFDKPLLAAVNGVGVGLGCTLLAHVDLVLMDERARLRAPFTELGVPPEAASSSAVVLMVGVIHGPVWRSVTVLRFQPPSAPLTNRFPLCHCRPAPNGTSAVPVIKNRCLGMPATLPRAARRSN